MTQDKHLDVGHRTNKSVYDQSNDDATTSGKILAKNSEKKNLKPTPKIQQADRKINQSNKSAIRKTLASSKAKVPVVNRDRNNRSKIGQPKKSLIVGNQNERVSATVDAIDDKDRANVEMTVVTQNQNHESLRESIPSEAIDSSKDTNGTIIDENNLDISETTPTAINTDLQEGNSNHDSVTSGISPTIENNNVTVAEKKDTDGQHLKISQEKTNAISNDSEIEAKGDSASSIKERSCLKPIPKTDDPIARLNALRANISNALKEVKAVLDQHAPPPSPSATTLNDDNITTTNTEDDGAVQFRFVKRVRTKSVIKFDEDEIICNAPPEKSTETTVSTTGAELSTNQGIAINDMLSKKESSAEPRTQPDQFEADDIKSNEITSQNQALKELTANTVQSGISITENTVTSKATTAIDSNQLQKIEQVSNSPGIFEIKVIESGPSIESNIQDSSNIIVQDNKPEVDRSKIDKSNIQKIADKPNKKSQLPQKPPATKQKDDATKIKKSTPKQNDLTKKQIKQIGETQIRQPDETIQKQAILESKEIANSVAKDIETSIDKLKIYEVIIKTNENKEDSKHESSEKVKGEIEYTAQNTDIEKTIGVDVLKPAKQMTQNDRQSEATIKKQENLENEKMVSSVPLEKAKVDDSKDNKSKLKDNHTIIKTTEILKDSKFKSSESTASDKGQMKDTVPTTDTEKTISIDVSKPVKKKLAKQKSLDIASPPEIINKKSVEKCANVELAAKEILKRTAVKRVPSVEKDVQSESTEKVSPKETQKTATPPITEKSIDQKKAVQEVKTKIPVIITKVVGPQMITKETGKSNTNEPTIHQKEAIKDKPVVDEISRIAKPPLSTRSKRGSLIETPKVSIKTVETPKRVSIGSESDLIKIAGKFLIARPKTESPSTSKAGMKDNDKCVATSATTTTSKTTDNSSSSATKSEVVEPKSAVEHQAPANSSATLKFTPSAESDRESLAEISRPPLSVANTTITQAIPSESNDGDVAKIASVPSQNTSDVGRPLISSPDKLVSSESVGLSGIKSVLETNSKMTVVKKDIVPNITPKQQLQELNEKVKDSELINDCLNNTLNLLPKISVPLIDQNEPLVKMHKDKLTLDLKPVVIENGEVKSSDIAETSIIPIVDTISKLEKVDQSQVHKPSDCSSTVETVDSTSPKTVTALSPAEDSTHPEEKETDTQAKIKVKVLKTKKLKRVASISQEEPQIEVDSNQEPNSKPKDELLIKSEQTTSDETQSSEYLTSTATESSHSETEKDSAPKTVKKPRKTKKKVVIRRIKRKLSRDGSLDEKAEPEVCEKPIAEPPAQEVEESTLEEEPIEEEPPAPKGPKSCLVKRSYTPGDIVLYADRIRKSVKWKKATVIEKITDISYKLEFDGAEKPAHISYIKKFTDKKVQFGGKEYLEIDYQQEYDSSEEEEVYNIWARV